MKISAILYACVIIAFFMPFFMVSCEKTELMTIDGIQLVIGGESQLKIDNLFSMKDSTEKPKPQKIKAHPLAMAAIALAAIALIVALLIPRKLYYIPIVLSVGGILCLHLLKNGMVAALAKSDTGLGSALDLTKILRVTPQYGFWMADVAFLGGAVSSLLTGLKLSKESQAELFLTSDVLELSPDEAIAPIFEEEDVLLHDYTSSVQQSDDDIKDPEPDTPEEDTPDPKA